MVRWLKSGFVTTPSSSVITLIPVGVALNLAIGTVVQIIKLPVFLDSIGTVIVAVLAGPLPAIATAVITVFVGGAIVNPVLPWFVGTAIAIGWFTGFCANRGAFKRVWTTVLAGLIMGVISAVVSAPIIVHLFGGVTQSGSSLVVAYLMATGKTVLKSVILAGIACDPVDKMLTYVVAFFLLMGLPERLRSRFPRGVQNTRQKH